MINCYLLLKKAGLFPGGAVVLPMLNRGVSSPHDDR